MKFQLLRLDASGTPICPLSLDVFSGITFNRTEDRWEIELETLHDLLNIGQHENVVLRVLATGPEDLPLIELVDTDESET